MLSRKQQTVEHNTNKKKLPKPDRPHKCKQISLGSSSGKEERGETKKEKQVHRIISTFFASESYCHLNNENVSELLHTLRIAGRNIFIYVRSLLPRYIQPGIKRYR